MLNTCYRIRSDFWKLPQMICPSIHSFIHVLCCWFHSNNKTEYHISAINSPKYNNLGQNVYYNNTHTHTPRKKNLIAKIYSNASYYKFEIKTTLLHSGIFQLLLIRNDAASQHFDCMSKIQIIPTRIMTLLYIYIIL